MPSLSSHVLIGLLPAIFPVSPNVAIAFAFGAIFPDLDFYSAPLATAIDAKYAAATHRVLSHSLLLVLLAIAVFTVLFMFRRFREDGVVYLVRIFDVLLCTGFSKPIERDPNRVQIAITFCAMFVLGVLSHICVDVFLWNVGVGLCWPLNCNVNLYSTPPDADQMRAAHASGLGFTVLLVFVLLAFPGMFALSARRLLVRDEIIVIGTIAIATVLLAADVIPLVALVAMAIIVCCCCVLALRPCPVSPAAPVISPLLRGFLLLYSALYLIGHLLPEPDYAFVALSALELVLFIPVIWFTIVRIMYFGMQQALQWKP
jgi:hypothetical protein